MIDAGIGANSASGGYDIDNSCKFEADNREYLRWTNFSNQASAARKKKFTFSAWVKRTELGGNQQVFISTSQNGYLTFEANNQLTWIQQYGGSQLVINTTRVFRDTASWYHIMVVVDTAQSTEADRTKIYVNGEQETVFDAAAYPSQNAEASNLFEQHLIVGEWGGGSLGFCGYMADYYFLSEIAAVPTDLGEFDNNSGIWKPKEYDGTISSPSHFLEFKDGSDLGTATAGLDSDYQNNLTAADQSTDTPTNNFATWQINNYNPTVSANFTFIEGATTPQRNSGDVHVYCVSTMAMSSGKWYMEYKVRSSSDTVYFGGTPITMFASENHNGYYLGQDGGGSIGYGASAFLYYWTGSNTQYTENRATGDIIGVALDKDNDKIAFSKNGTFMLGSNGVRSDPATPSTMHEVQAPPYFWAFGAFTGNIQYETNMGGYTSMSISSAASDANGYGTFEYAPPTGYYALCTKNLAEYG